MHVTRPAPDVTAFTDHAMIPSLGFLPVKAFVLHAEQPVLIDTGMPVSRPDFLEAVWSTVDPADLRWIYLTHPDRDHTGSLTEVLAAAPQARLVTTFLGYGILGLDYHIPPDRLHLLNPGQALDVGDRTLRAFRPPVFDSPATTGFYDELTGVCFTSDCFGGPAGSAAEAEAEDIAELHPDDLLAAQRLWVTVDSPWVASLDQRRFSGSLEPLRRLNPPLVLSTHLPPARNAMPRLLDMLESAPDAAPYVGPDQVALEQLLAGFEPQPA